MVKLPRERHGRSRSGDGELRAVVVPERRGGGQAAGREGEAALWAELNDRLREAGLLVTSGRLHAVDTATTIRVRRDEVELTDGPFAATKEALAGFYVLECADLDEALAQAARLPLARYGSVEVRPLAMDEPDASAAASA
jgi:hypothetical protein